MLKFIMTDEDAQRVYARKLAGDRESQKRKRAEELPEQRESRLAAKRESEKRKHAEELPEQRRSRLAAKRECENDSDDDWVWDFDLEKVINDYQILVKKTKVRRYVFHSEAEK